jgi:hypothetical protein
MTWDSTASPQLINLTYAARAKKRAHQHAHWKTFTVYGAPCMRTLPIFRANLLAKRKIRNLLSALRNQVGSTHNFFFGGGGVGRGSEEFAVVLNL